MLVPYNSGVLLDIVTYYYLLFYHWGLLNSRLSKSTFNEILIIMSYSAVSE